MNNYFEISKGENMSADEIKAQWRWQARDAANRGSYLHAVIGSKQFICFI